MTPARRKIFLFSVFAALSLVLDQWTKALAREYLRPRGPMNPKVVVQNFFDLRYAENPGVAFSMFQDLPGGRLLLTVLAIGAFAMVIAYLRRTPEGATRLHVALGLIGGGAIGNLVDRVIYGRVTDFIVWKKGSLEWPAFNIADAALCIGVGLMLLDLFLSRKEAAPSA
ncbi:MAG TPA: signal peptidase II [Polyangia bacterium]|nr:signal peptidase II [Polyangia bacterium]